MIQAKGFLLILLICYHDCVIAIVSSSDWWAVILWYSGSMAILPLPIVYYFHYLSKAVTHDCSCCKTYIHISNLSCFFYVIMHTQSSFHTHTHAYFNLAYLLQHYTQMKGGPLSFNNRIWWIPSLLRVEKTSSLFALLVSSIQNSTWLNPISTVIWIKDLD